MGEGRGRTGEVPVDGAQVEAAEEVLECGVRRVTAVVRVD